jgi:hypothetical protein
LNNNSSRKRLSCGGTPSADAAMSPTRLFKFYGRMKSYDLIISVEYCNNCYEHPAENHEEAQYEQNALFTLLYIAEQVPHFLRSLVQVCADLLILP